MNPTVTLIVVNYNGQGFLRDCLDSIFAQSRPADEVIVIDNASTDQSLVMLEEICRSRRGGSRTAPTAKLISFSTNVGFAAGCNRGIVEARSDLIGILNNDIVLDSRWLECLLAHNSSQWDFWASRILLSSNPDRVDSAGDGMATVGAAYKIGHGEPASQHEQPGEVFGPCAAAALYRRTLLEKVGGFDPDFFLVYEDADLNMRARLQGCRCLYVPQAIVFHRVNSSIRTFSNVYVFYGHRNSEYVFWKNMPTPLLLRYLPERFAFNFASFVFFLFKGRSGSFLKAKVDFVRNLPAVLRKRRQIQQSRKLGAGEFQRFLEPNWVKYRRKVAVSP